MTAGLARRARAYRPVLLIAAGPCLINGVGYGRGRVLPLPLIGRARRLPRVFFYFVGWNEEVTLEFARFYCNEIFCSKNDA